jgi:Asp-tRNA(Asn)/Glu-tRNA(Gln) amidotransferase A subunit family amidase
MALMPATSSWVKRVTAVAIVLILLPPYPLHSQSARFQVMEATIKDVHDAYKSRRLTARQLVQMYLDRIEAYDRSGPAINSVINVNPKALEEADRLDAAMKSGFVGPLHGIPVVLKDMIDVAGMPTTYGSSIMKDFIPTRDAFVVEKLKKAGAIVLAKVTLGEFAGGDTFGSLFGETRNPYDPLRTVGGSSGGTGASVAANFGTVGIGQEGFASISRPAAWNNIVGLRPTPGLVSGGGFGPMTRTVADLATVLDVIAGYDPESPETALGVGNVPATYTRSLDRNGLKGARIGILREPMGYFSEPQSDDFKAVTGVFDKAVAELKAAGAVIVDPITIPNLTPLLAKRRQGGGRPSGMRTESKAAQERDQEIRRYLAQIPNAKYRTLQEVQNGPERRSRGTVGFDGDYADYRVAQDDLMINTLKVMADHRLDAIVYKTVEHTPTLLRDYTNPPYSNMKGTTHLSTFLGPIATISVPAGFTPAGLPVGITFFGRAFSEAALIKLAYGYEQATHHRTPPKTTPALTARPSP